MEEIQVWASLGREIGIKYCKFELIYSRIFENISKIQQESLLVKEMILNTESGDNDAQKCCSQYILHLETSLSKQTDLIILSCIKTVLKRLSKIIDAANKRLRIKKATKLCQNIKTLLVNYISKPYSAIVIAAIQEIDNYIVVLCQRFQQI